MNVLLKKSELAGYFLVKLKTKRLVMEIMEDVRNGRYLKAAKTAMQKGEILKKVDEKDLGMTEANLILTEERAHFDLTV